MKVTCLSLGLDRSSFEAGLTQSWIGAPIVKHGLEAVKSFSDYSKQARLLTDFTPDLILISIQDRYSHRLQKALELKKNSEPNEDEISLNTRRMQDILKDIEPYSKTLFAGVIEGIIENGDELRESLRELGVKLTTPGEAIDNTIDALKI
jgi:hypothetical protein